MKNNANTNLRSQFKIQTTKAVLAIVFFILAYLFMVVFGVGLTIGGVYLGIIIIAAAPSLLTILIGIGLGSLGVLVLIFLLKFIFSTNKIDRSHLKEITAKDEPELFKLIKEIVQKVGTDFPKKVYLSSDVNACVFYDSSFWSMLFPTKKNLQIGLGLVNTVSKSELKAILSHEFGHFSQKTMKLGSYVYHVNQVIHNLLYQNDGYERLIQNWSGGNAYIAFFVGLAVRIILGIQWILQKLYEVVNKSYMGLSREMEFHADEVAASVTGIEPIKSSLLRMSLADSSFNSVLSFYESKIYHSQKSSNIYKEQEYVMQFLAAKENLKIENGLPYLPEDALSQYDKSKLVIDNQWASHPSIEDRINRLKQLKLPSKELDHSRANRIFKQYQKWEKERTDALFGEIKYKEVPTRFSFESFEREFYHEFEKNSFSNIYNGYYDEKNPTKVDLKLTAQSTDSHCLNELFSNDRKEVVVELTTLENDQETIRQIAEKIIPLKTFDYDGKKYNRKEAQSLFKTLEKDVLRLKQVVKEYDQEIFQFFKKTESMQGITDKLETHYSALYEYEDQFDLFVQFYKDFSDNLQFVQYTLPVEEIHQNFNRLKPKEQELKGHLRNFLDDSKCQSEITSEIRENMELYISKEWKYFGNVMYYDKNLEILQIALQNFIYVASRKYFLLKKELLNYQVSLTSNN